MRDNNLIYNFYKATTQRFTTIDELLAVALPIMAEYFDAQRIFFFDWKEEESIISLRTMCQEGACYELQEDVFVDKRSPEFIKFLHDGVMPAPTLDYPAVYVLLSWQTPRGGLKTLKEGRAADMQFGVLRVERFKKNKPFSEEEESLLLALGRELSVKVNMTEVDYYNTSQLLRAQALNELAKVFATSLRLSDSINEILKNIQKTFHFDRTSLYLLDVKKNKFSEAYTADLSGEVKEIDVKEMYKVFSLENYEGQNICPLTAQNDIVLSLPLRLQNKNLGWLVFDNMLSRVPIAEEDILSLKQFSSQIALAVDNARLFERVQELSNYDELTKLALRRFFKENLTQEIYRSKRFNLALSLILMDIDHFKVINDTYGHILGDEALKAVSEVIRQSLRQTDIPCRYGGDEILILLPRTTGEEAKSIAKRLSERVSKITLPARLTRGEDIKLSVSQGIAVFPYDSDNASSLIQRADDALYYVKEHGRGFFSLYNEVASELSSYCSDKTID